MTRFFFLLTLLCFSLSSFAQTVKVQGILNDVQGEGIPGAYIIDLNTKKASSSNIDGEFLMKAKVKDEQISLRVSHTGFQDTIISIAHNNQETYLIELTLNSLTLSEVVVEGKTRQTTTLQNLDPLAAKAATTASGDFINATLSTEMGVAINNELSASYSVRGGSYDENLIYVNGIEIYRPFLIRAGEQEGLSFVNSDLVESIQFSAGGFPARYGDKMSSVLDIQYKKPKETGGGFEASMLGGAVYFENAWKNQKITQVTGVRYRSNQYILGSLDTDGEYKPRFGDLQTFWNFQISPKSNISVLGQYANNLYRFIPKTRETEFGGIQQALRLTVFFDGQEQSSYNSGTGNISWEYQAKDNLKWQTYLSHFRTQEREQFDVVGQYFLDEIEKDKSSEDFGQVVQNLGVGGFLNHARNGLDANVTTFGTKAQLNTRNHLIRWGVEGRSEQLKDRIKEWVYIDSADYSLPQSEAQLSVTQFIQAKNEFHALKATAFIEDQFSLYTNKENEVQFNLGIRGSHNNFNNQTLFSPRGSIAYLPQWKKQVNDTTVVNKSMTLRLGGGVYYQVPFYRELRNIDGQIDNSIEAQRSIHLVGGIDYPLFIWGRPFVFKSELYYKWMDNLIPYELDNIRIRYYGENNAKGFVRGIDFKINGEFVKGIESWATLSFLEAKEDIANDRYVNYYNEEGGRVLAFSQNQNIVDSTVVYPGYIPRPTDQRVLASIFFRDEMPRNKSLKVQLNLVFGTGLPYGPPTFERYKDTLRTRSYRRVDIGFSKDLITEKTKNNGIFKHFKDAFIAVEIFNLLQINNVVNYQWVRDVNGIQHSVPNYLTSRRVNIKLVGRF